MSEPEAQAGVELGFKQVDSSIVYETSQATRPAGWSGYLLPLPTSELPDEISFDDSLTKFGGHYLFSVNRPELLPSNPVEFANKVRDYITKSTNNRAVLWLQPGAPPDFGDFDRFGFAFTFFNSVYQTTSNMNSSVGANVTFFVLQQSRLQIDSAQGALRIFASASITPPFLGFNDSNGDPLGIQVAATGTAINIYVPFSGDNTGCCTFAGSMTTRQVFGDASLGPDFRFIVNDSSRGQKEPIRYRVYPLAELPGSLDLACTFDPTDPVNKFVSSALLEQGYLRSGFAIKGQPTLTSAYRTSGGNTVMLTPLGTAADDLAPALGAGGFAWASESEKETAANASVVYLGLVGQHGIGVRGRAAGQPQLLLGGLFGSETLSFVTYDRSKDAAQNDRLYALPSQPGYAPVFPFDTVSLEVPDSGAVQERLKDTYLVAWSTIQAGAGTIDYCAEPEGSPLYGQVGNDLAASNGVSVLLSTPPHMPLPQGNDKTFPMVPYGAAAGAEGNGDTLTQFESQIIAATRKTTISNAADETWQARESVLQNLEAVQPDWRTTPQGFVVQVDNATGAYLNVAMAQSLDRDNQLQSFAFDHPTRQLQDALQTNQLFLVAVNDQHLVDDTKGANFANVVNMAGWKMTVQVGKGVTPTSYRNVMIFKFCDGTLQERVTNPNRWTSPDDFSLIESASGDSIPALAYAGLSQWLQDYITEGIKRADGPSGAFYQNFTNIVTDPEWRGVIVLEADLSAEDLPPQIQGLAAGIDFTHFTAHHFGFTVSRVSVDKDTRQIEMEGVSSLFGLVDYLNPAYALNLAVGADPDTPVPVQTSGDFDFTVLQLQSLFENARLVDFQSHVQLTVDQLFASPVLRTYNLGVAMPANGVVLNGSYVDQNGEASYVFQQTKTSVFTLDGNVLPAVAFSRVQFNTLGPRDGGTVIASRFLIWGSFDFVELKDTQGELLDVLSFGSPPDTDASQLGAGLAFSNLLINMTFPITTPNAKTLVLDTDNMAYDLNASEVREESLFQGFGLQLKTFMNAAGGKTPADYGYLPVTSGLNLTTLGESWFGVVYEVTLGGPGALASAVGFNSNLLMAWSATTKPGDAQHAVFLGLSLPGAAPGASLFSIEGVFKVSVGSIAILRQGVPKTPGSDAGSEDKFFYCLRLDDIGIKILGFVKLPPDANIQFFLFGDPNNTGALGWYAAYVASDNPGSNQQALLGLAPLDGELAPTSESPNHPATSGEA
jgi:hypothetical protein